MKKIISGKVYDTATAEALAQYSPKLSRTDFRYYEETLHRKRTGEFFIYGWGGPASHYAVRAYDGFDGGEAIIPMSYDGAKKWAKDHLSADEYEAIFGEVVEDDSKVTASFSIRSDTYHHLKKDADRAGVSIGAYLDHLVSASHRP